MKWKDGMEMDEHTIESLAKRRYKLKNERKIEAKSSLSAQRYGLEMGMSLIFGLFSQMKNWAENKEEDVTK